MNIEKIFIGEVDIFFRVISEGNRLVKLLLSQPWRKIMAAGLS
jgi:hypothetical protein